MERWEVFSTFGWLAGERMGGCFLTLGWLAGGRAFLFVCLFFVCLFFNLGLACWWTDERFFQHWVGWLVEGWEAFSTLGLLAC